MLEVAARQLSRLAAVEVDDEEVLPPVAREADAVELVEDARESPRGALLVVFLFVGLVTNARAERDALRVRRPGDLLDALLLVGQLARLSALGRDDVEVHGRLLVAAVGGEREPVPVRRPARRRVPALAGGELPRLRRSVERSDPDRAAILVRLAVDRGDDESNARAVRRDARVAGVDELVDVFRQHPSHGAGL